MAMLAAFSLAACSRTGADTANGIPDEGASQQDSIYTAEYEGQKFVVDSTGASIEDYSVDDNGNAVNEKGKIVAEAESIDPFVFADSVDVISKDNLNFELGSQLDSNNNRVPVPALYEIGIRVTPSNVTCKEVTVQTNNSQIVSFSMEHNSAIASQITSQNNGAQVMEFEVNENGEAFLVVTASTAGETVLTFTTKDGNALCDLPIKVTSAASNFDAVNTAGLNMLTDAKTCYIKGNGANLRDGTTYNARVLATLESGMQVKVISIDGDWAKVYYGNVIGYVKAVYLSDTLPPAVLNTPKPSNNVIVPSPYISDNGNLIIPTIIPDSDIIE